ncbi:hypothetical protein [Methylococcus capsulatus]|jgi:hypothetical protein|uniref:hypothetical protein n=1 Tax=Methylococcus capsulatus TaxID=414 RepID=UPI001C532E77|nr:hypothetical protein [Methylococcus capsulatus]QXP89478.1 hypothetical protein KW114_10180 [Methylococcus capsulatus]
MILDHRDRLEGLADDPALSALSARIRLVSDFLEEGAIDDALLILRHMERILPRPTAREHEAAEADLRRWKTCRAHPTYCHVREAVDLAVRELLSRTNPKYSA